MKLVIDRSRWLRGTGAGELLNPESGKMCCLGFFGLACGLSRGRIRGKSVPANARSKKWPSWLVGPADLLDCNDLVDANDRQGTARKRREARIAAIFAKHGVEVTFVDSEVKP